MQKTDATNKTKEILRPPVVTIMGHVDHGKTSLLDAIRHANVAAKEFGGITQHTSSYQIDHNGRKITFIDTPGHAAFSNMRSRGGKVADIVVLVVSADDGVMPQTKEVISHVKNAGVPMIVAINKVDLPQADIQKTKQTLAQENVLVEDWGGDVICVEVSATKKLNLDKLLDSILLTADFADLKADPDGELEAFILESKMDRKKGTLVYAIVKNGTLHVGEDVWAGGQVSRIRSITDTNGKSVKSALPSDPIEISGFKRVLNAGDLIVRKGSDLEELAVDDSRIEIIGQDTKKVIGVILKADTQGTLEAIKASLSDIVTAAATADFSIKFTYTGSGDISDSDVSLATGTKSVIIGFNVKAGTSALELAEEKKIPVKIYHTIYSLLDEVTDMLQEAAFSDEAKVKGRAEILKMFKLPSGDLVIGCKVLAGALKVNKRVSIYSKNPADLAREDTPVYTGSVKRLKIKHDDVSIVGKDNECGVFLKPQFDNAEPGFFIEVIN
jgi:translation initiation factor IF-2